MSTTCDYCHKPLSLMRRLRGEQFCSVEHLDLYTAQQAEFALQRLAASVDDKPLTQRPPALLKRIARQPAHANGNGTSTGAGQHDVAVSEPPSQEYLRVSGGGSTPPAAYKFESAPEPEPEPVDYPMASFTLTSPVEPRAPRPTRPQPLDPATTEIAASKPRLDAEPTGAPHLAPLQEFAAPPELEAVEPESIPSSATEPIAAAAETSALPDLPLDAESVVASWTNQELIQLYVAPAESARLEPELLARPVDLPAEFTAPKPDLSMLRVDATDLLIAPPAPAEPRTTSLRPLSGHLKLSGLVDFAPAQAFEPAFEAKVDAQPFAMLPLAPRIPWSPKPLANTLGSTTLFGAVEPDLTRELPVVPEWPLTQALIAPTVPLPDATPRSAEPASPRGDESWLPSAARLQTPRMPLAAPHVSMSGPAFGWSLARPKTTLLSANIPTEEQAASITGITAPPVAPSVRPALVDLETTATQWSRLRNSSPSEIAAEPNLPAAGLAPRFRDFRARVEARLNALQHQNRHGWATPRTDATMLEPSVDANARPAALAVEPRTAPLAALGQPGLKVLGSALGGPSLLDGPALPSSTPDSWAFPTGAPQTSIDLEPAASLQPGPISPNAPHPPERPAAIATLEPMRYRPVSLVSLPAPNYRLQSAAITSEGRFVALAPTGVYRLPRIQHTGYRMPGPYPKVPPCMPDPYLAAPTTTVPPADLDIPIIWTWTRQDETSIPRLEGPAPMRLHPADYFAWPSIKTPRTERILPLRETDTVLGAAVGNNPGPRRFGPARASLQGPLNEADVLDRTGA